MTEAAYIKALYRDCIARRRGLTGARTRAELDAYRVAAGLVCEHADCRDLADELDLMARIAARDTTAARDDREGRAETYALAANMARNAKRT